MSMLRALRGAILGSSFAAIACVAHAGDVPVPTGQNVAPSPHTAAITRRDTSIDRSGQYRSELQACRSGQSVQSLDSCLEEARNAQAARRHGELALAGEDYRANALARCKPFTGEDRVACEARVLGFGNTSGSVAGGGLLRWVETAVVPPGRDEVTLAPKTAEPLVIVPVGSR